MISQSRLRDAILAGQDFESALRKLLGQIEAMRELDPSPGILALASAPLESLLEHPIESARTLAVESERLRLTWRRNQRRNALRRAALHPEPELREGLAEYEEWKAGLSQPESEE